MPKRAVYVGRPSRWGNPHNVGMCGVCGVEHTQEEAVLEFEAELMMDMNYQARDAVHRELAGKDLACWCPLDQPCHADVLLRVANIPSSPASETGEQPQRKARRGMSDYFNPQVGDVVKERNW